MRTFLIIMLLSVLSLATASCSGDESGCTPQQEVCDGEDNDCDGIIDEDLSTDADGDGHFSEDSCGEPHDDCNDHDVDIYHGKMETCDGKDNDCDGTTDENCACNPGDQEPCGTDEGECTIGTRVCQANGNWGNCSGQEPTAEICDGKDNNCDGTTDNPTTPQPCELTVGVCAGVTRTGCEACNYGQYYEETETTCDQLDNDCDGLTDAELLNDTHEPNGNCGQGVLNPLAETENSSDFVIVEGTLDLWNLDQPVDDIDWYLIHLDEADHTVECLISGPDQCFDFVTRLELPAGADHTQWEMCIVDGMSGSCADFGDPDYTFCTEEAYWQQVSNSYHMTLTWGGTCGIEDGGDFYLLVRAKQDQHVNNCNPYKLYLQFWYVGTTACL